MTSNFQSFTPGAVGGVTPGSHDAKQSGPLADISHPSPSPWDGLLRVDPRMMAGFVVCGAAVIPAINLLQRDAVLSAPLLGIGDIPSQVLKLHERRDLEERFHNLDRSLARDSGQSGSADTQAADKALGDELRCQLDRRGPEDVFKIAAVATLQSSKHVAGIFANAADGEVFYYTLSAPELGAQKVILQTHQRLAPDNQKAEVLFATDLSRVQLIDGELILVPASMPNIVGIPGSGEAILEFQTLPK